MANGVCTNTPGGYECTCAAGYTGDGIRCHSEDECRVDDDCEGNNELCVREREVMRCRPLRGERREKSFWKCVDIQ